jgi:hypothetical protein
MILPDGEYVFNTAFLLSINGPFFILSFQEVRTLISYNILFVRIYRYYSTVFRLFKIIFQKIIDNTEY